MAHDPLDVAYTLHTTGRLDEAEAVYRRILSSDPSASGARNNLFALLRDARPEDALTLAAEAVDLSPTDWTWRWRMFHLLASEGRWAEAWPHYEARRWAGSHPVRAPGLPMPEWKGQHVRSLILWLEQGFGDMIQFARYVPLLTAQGVDVHLACKPPLVRLLEPLGVNIVPIGPSVRLPQCDAWAMIGSLPWRFGTTPANVPPPLKIAADPAPSGGRIGVVTRGRPTHPNDEHRSLPEVEEARLLAIPGAVSLDPAHTGARDFQDTASIIAGLEAVVTVDTAVAHLAGSMGKPTFILLPAHRPDWRWLRSGETTPWYPSVRLVRQEEPGEWSSALDRAIALATD